MGGIGGECSRREPSSLIRKGGVRRQSEALLWVCDVGWMGSYGRKRGERVGKERKARKGKGKGKCLSMTWKWRKIWEGVGARCAVRSRRRPRVSHPLSAISTPYISKTSAGSPTSYPRDRLSSRGHRHQPKLIGCPARGQLHPYRQDQGLNG